MPHLIIKSKFPIAQFQLFVHVPLLYNYKDDDVEHSLF